MQVNIPYMGPMSFESLSFHWLPRRLWPPKDEAINRVLLRQVSRMARARVPSGMGVELPRPLGVLIGSMGFEIQEFMYDYLCNTLHRIMIKQHLKTEFLHLLDV